MNDQNTVVVYVRKSWYLDMAQKKKDKWNALAEKIRLIILNLVKVKWSEYVLRNTDNPSLKKSESNTILPFESSSLFEIVNE